ncbi:glutathione peroxidase [Alloalcanivorax sp. C16-2]|uniref:glutathione peroxidase n=1 Tax=Alloalcanivorax sp. C16-2 TaxID=3390052 RepID=UPI003970E4BE
MSPLRFILACALGLGSLLLGGPARAADGEAACPALFQHEARKLHSKEDVDLCALTTGKVVLVVNTASQCGFTPQFKGLEALYKTYRDQGLVVLGFPSDAFRQELDDEGATAKVCYVNYGVTFPMMATSPVRGPDANPVFQALNRAAGEPEWNFNKYLVNRDGEVLRHFPSSAKPRGGELEAAVQAALR